MTSPSPSEGYGLALPSRRANITVTRRSSLHSEEEDDSIAPLSRDSLEGTRRYYNVDSSPNPSGGGPPRARTISNTNSPRPLSATPSESSFSLRSPPRGSVPLPTPRGFLAPQKPAAARRLEQRERSTTVSTTGRASSDVREIEGVPTPSDRRDFSHVSYNVPPLPNVSPHITHKAPTASSPAPSQAPTPRRTRQTSTNRNPSQGPTTPTRHGAAPGGSDSTGHGYENGWDRGTDSSSPSHGHLPELSSDHLVALGAEEKSRKSGQTGGSSASNRDNGRSISTTVRKFSRFEKTGSTFFCGGKMMTGGDTPLSFILSIILILGISGVWVGTTGVWLWLHATDYGFAKGGGIAIVVVFAYIFGLCVSSMIAASFREPGILPRELDPDPPYTPVDVYYEASPREILVGKDGKDKVQVKYCETCKSYRPPRCSHCRLCGNCVEGIDHHCAYLHGCVGRRNYFAFLVFVIITAIADIYIVVFSALHFSLLCQHDKIDFKTALGNSPGAAVSFILGILTLPPVLFLLYYHIRLLLYNLTTIEQIRASASSNLFRATTRPYNPFAASSRWTNVVRASIARPQFPSWIDAGGWAVDDNRRVNPALTTPEKYLELV